VVTKKTHFNPCFWTAYWNNSYYEKAVSAGVKNNCRTQGLFSLNIRAGKILPTTPEKSHYEKFLGVSEIAEEGEKQYIKENFPDEYEKFVSEIDSEDYPLTLCYENIFSKLEELPPYKILENVISKRIVSSFEEKVWISCFVILQRMRGHAFINSMTEAGELLRKPKFEFMLSFRHMLMNEEFLFRVTLPVAQSKWTFHVSDRHRLPLCDSPILQTANNIMVALSPRLLLEIELGKEVPDSVLVKTKRLNKKKVSEYKKRTIENTYREIILGNKQVLELYLNDPHFKLRKTALDRASGYNKVIKLANGKEIYHVRA